MNPIIPTGVLLVVGTDDLHVISNLLKVHNVEQVFALKQKASLHALLTTIDVEIVRSEIDRVGIVMDADFLIDDATGASSLWTSLRDRLRDLGYDGAPYTPDVAGTIIGHSDLPQIGIWIMPDNESAGILEHFIEFLVKPDDVLWAYAAQCIESLPEVKFPESRAIKAQVHTWLAWQNEPGKPMGSAIACRYLDSNAEYAQLFISWIRRLFIEPIII